MSRFEQSSGSSDEPGADASVEPASVVAEMASAVDRVRRMVTDVFKDDAELFADD